MIPYITPANHYKSGQLLKLSRENMPIIFLCFLDKLRVNKIDFTKWNKIVCLAALGRLGFVIFNSTAKRILERLNTQYMTNSTLVCPVKIEYVTKNDIFCLKRMMKSGLEKIILKFLHAQAIFY